MYMKAIQVTFDERLLKLLDADEEVRKAGRSAVLRRAAREYLERRREQQIDEAYRRAYSGGTPLDDELKGWEDEGVWPEI